MSRNILSSILLGTSLTLVLVVISVERADAAALSGAKDQLTNSRPSASTPLSANASSGAGAVSVIDNGSRYLASDSAKLYRMGAGAADVDSSLIIATQSGALTTVTFADTLGAAGQAGTDVLIANQTAMHTIQFTTVTAIPGSGDILIEFPGAFTGEASPSASTFSFNGLTSANAGTFISYNLDGSDTCTFTVSTTGTPSILCTVSGPIPGGTQVTFNVGCADAATNSASCTTQSPKLINPIKAAAAGTADIWGMNITTRDASDNPLDSASIRIGTQDSVLVQATVDPTLTFAISAPANNGQAVNTGNNTGCTNSENINTGINPSVTSVNLGVLSTSSINISAQLITISTNAQNGYTLQATSSGHLVDPATGYFLADDSSLPGSFFTAGTTQFGIHACGLDVNATNWGTGATGGGANARYAWPAVGASGALTLASDSSGPIANSIAAGNGLTTVEYAATMDGAVPAGQYRAIVTYIATATF